MSRCSRIETVRLVHDEQPRSGRCERAVRFGAVTDLIARTGRQDDGAVVLQLRVQLAFQAEQDVTLGAPVIGPVSG